MHLKNPSLSSLFTLSIFFPCISSLFFNISRFDPRSAPLIECQGDAAFNESRLQLTDQYAQLGSDIRYSIGRAVYKQEVFLWDNKTRELTDFTTHFSFIITKVGNCSPGDGMTFFLAKHTRTTAEGSSSKGGFLGLYGNKTEFSNFENGIVAVEFDTYKNPWDPPSDHVGIDVNSIVSVANVSLNSSMANVLLNSSMANGITANAWVTYDSSTKTLSVFLTYDENPVDRGSSILSYNIDLRKFLPSKVAVGFSASTGLSAELHQILSWSFSSTLEEKTETSEKENGSKVGLIVGLAASFGTVLLILFSGGWHIRRCMRQKKQEDSDIEREFDKEKGPQRYASKELVAATNNFSLDRKLGEGGFGEVYKGVFKNNEEVAIKRVSSESKQGKKEFMSEVRIISRLRHRNLVQLVGWCHKQNEFILVYKYMNNLSLDYHLYGDEKILPWPVRYNIALGLASALLYLHEEWEQCVVHRDIKPSNVMLDSEFEAKLGDFGLARLVDHEIGSQTTVLAGTMGYMAPESVTISRARKESDVFSFGVVALEIACGRKPVAFGNVTLVSRVWELYGQGMILEAVDPRLGTNFDQDEVERLTIVGLWCAHPNYEIRPTIRQAIAVLKFEAPLPSLPPTMPVPVYSTASTSNSSTATEFSGSSASSLLENYKTDIYNR